ncbi:type IV toxin-antitoxin system AbiEi family antitoxin domain-containing protein [Novosphingobium sp. BL-8H]|uniref:type IV toxin-antitoxin system AbiEi family antitoxin domain-containing protein n=1 Tax=Novosphingobium sp. BL-8H TaxID=3127640 RepID=UPI0037564AE2
MVHSENPWAEPRPGTAKASDATAPASQFRSLRQCAVLPFQERKFIQLLRLHATASRVEAHALTTALTTVEDAIKLLAAEAVVHGLAIFSPGSAFVSADESAILDRLARFQRPSQWADRQPANRLEHVLKACAALLAGHGRRMAPRPQQMEDHPGVHVCLRADTTRQALPPRQRSTQGKVPPIWDGVQEPPPGTLRARALDIVRRHGIATTAHFLAIGMTYQQLSKLHKQGYVRKAGHGRYTLPAAISR